ncbi:hypothetical protein L1887_59570 [Cichorium endivia]|nr:hypothetical protein L1887_59570 [Cichorium endivia]
MSGWLLCCHRAARRRLSWKLLLLLLLLLDCALRCLVACSRSWLQRRFDLNRPPKPREPGTSAVRSLRFSLELDWLDQSTIELRSIRIASKRELRFVVAAPVKTFFFLESKIGTCCCSRARRGPVAHGSEPRSPPATAKGAEPRRARGPLAFDQPWMEWPGLRSVLNRADLSSPGVEVTLTCSTLPDTSDRRTERTRSFKA